MHGQGSTRCGCWYDLETIEDLRRAHDKCMPVANHD
jgi:hypothetical protein